MLKLYKIIILRNGEYYDHCYGEEYEIKRLANKWIKQYEQSDTVNEEKYEYTYTTEECI